MFPPVMKPMGYSLFPQEIIPMPLAWVKADVGANLVWCKRHGRVCTPPTPPTPHSWSWSD